MTLYMAIMAKTRTPVYLQSVSKFHNLCHALHKLSSPNPMSAYLNGWIIYVSYCTWGEILIYQHNYLLSTQHLLIMHNYGQQIEISWWQLTNYCNSSPYSLTGYRNCFPVALPVSAQWTVHLNKWYLFNSIHTVPRVFHNLTTCLGWAALNESNAGQ